MRALNYLVCQRVTHESLKEFLALNTPGCCDGDVFLFVLFVLLVCICVCVCVLRGWGCFNKPLSLNCQLGISLDQTPLAKQTKLIHVCWWWGFSNWRTSWRWKNSRYRSWRLRLTICVASSQTRWTTLRNGELLWLRGQYQGLVELREAVEW